MRASVVSGSQKVNKRTRGCGKLEAISAEDFVTAKISEQLNALRTEIDALRRENRTLADKLDKLAQDHTELLSAHNDFGKHYDGHLEHTAAAFMTIVDAINEQVTVTQGDHPFKPGALIAVTRELEDILAKRRRPSN